MRKSFAFQNGLGLPVLLENQCTVLSPSLLYWGGGSCLQGNNILVGEKLSYLFWMKKLDVVYCGNDFSSPENLIKEEILCLSNSTIE